MNTEHKFVVITGASQGIGASLVKTFPKGTNPSVPATWPNVPILLDSPVYPTMLETNIVEVKVAASVIGATAGMKFDGATSALKVNANLHAPLLCISDILSAASGHLSLAGRTSSTKQ